MTTNGNHKFIHPPLPKITDRGILFQSRCLQNKKNNVQTTYSIISYWLFHNISQYGNIHTYISYTLNILTFSFHGRWLFYVKMALTFLYKTNRQPHMLTYSWNHTNTQQRTDVRPHPPCILCCKHLYSFTFLSRHVNFDSQYAQVIWWYFFNYNIFNRFVYMKYSD